MPGTLWRMRTVLPDPPPADFAELLERRRREGTDRYEVWEGVVHVSPDPSGAHLYIQQQLAVLLAPLAAAAGLQAGIGSFNLGEQGDYRQPDGGLFRAWHFGVWQQTAALAIEILSPGDETYEKLDFYAAHHVDELLIVDPKARTVDWRQLTTDGYQATERSALIDLGPTQLAAQLDWPPLEQD